MSKCIGWKTIIRLVIVKYNGITADIPIKHDPVETQILIRTNMALVKTELSGTVKYSIPFIFPKCTPSPANFAGVPSFP